jgi:hypothetical protein
MVSSHGQRPESGPENPGDVSSPLAPGFPAPPEQASKVDPSALELPEVLRKLPPEQREVIESTVHSLIYSGPAANPIASKLTSEHVTQIIGFIGKQTDKECEERREVRKYNFFGYFLVGLVALLLVLWYAVRTNQRELLIGVAIALMSFIGGYGIGMSRRGREG